MNIVINLAKLTSPSLSLSLSLLLPPSLTLPSLQLLTMQTESMKKSVTITEKMECLAKTKVSTSTCSCRHSFFVLPTYMCARTYTVHVSSIYLMLFFTHKSCYTWLHLTGNQELYGFGVLLAGHLIGKVA